MSIILNEFTNHGLNPKVVQCNLSSNAQRDAFPKKDRRRSRLVAFVRGAIHDVVVESAPGIATLSCGSPV